MVPRKDIGFNPIFTHPILGHRGMNSKYQMNEPLRLHKKARRRALPRIAILQAVAAYCGCSVRSIQRQEKNFSLIEILAMATTKYNRPRNRSTSAGTHHLRSPRQGFYQRQTLRRFPESTRQSKPSSTRPARTIIDGQAILDTRVRKGSSLDKRPPRHRAQTIRLSHRWKTSDAALPGR